MEVKLSANLETKLFRLAAQRGRDAETLIEEAIERLVDYEDWFLQEVDKGISSADRGELIDHSDVRRMIDSRYPG